MAEKRKFKNQVQKLALRQIRGCLQPWQRSNPVRFFNKYSRNCCFKLSDLLDSQGEIQNDHVILGFTKDGSHLISYSLVIDTTFELECPLYCYGLHWWRFRYNKPLVKVHSVPLFSNQSISDNLHLIISQSLDEKQVIVWGRSFTCPEEQTCRCYVTICASIPTKPCVACQQVPQKKCVEHSFAIHFSYETLPPYPVLLPSISLSIPGVVLLNCGDFLVAIKCTPCSDISELEKAMQDFRQLGKKSQRHSLRQKTLDEIGVEGKLSKSVDKSEEELHENVDELECLRLRRMNADDVSKDRDDFVKKESQDENSNDLASSPLNQLLNGSTETFSWQFSQTTATYQSTSQPDKSNDSGSHTKYSFKTYYNKSDFTTTCEECDVIDHEIPITVDSNGHEMEFHQLSRDIPSVLVCQAFLDMEECINELIESHKDLQGRYKSLCDYDSQFLSACRDTGDVIVMVKVLIYAKPTNSCFSEGLQLSPSPQLHQTGFVFSWNIWNGVYRTLHFLDVENHPDRKDFSRSEYSMAFSRRLRQDTAVPVGFTSQVRVFSNHTVFTEKSLKYLMHPFLPIVIVF